MRLWRSLTHAAMPDPARASQTVIIRKGRPATHAEFVHEVRRWHSAFLQVDGSSVALYFDQAGDFAAALYGAWHAGKHVVLLADAQPATLERLMPRVQACAGSLPGALKPADPPSAQYELAPLSLTDTSVALFTSGSTGEPEQILKTLAQLNAEVSSLQEVFGADIDQASPAWVYATVSHQHIYGLLFRVLWPLAAARPAVSERLNYPEEIISALSGADNAILVSSPALLSRLPAHLDWPASHAALRAVFSSGGPLLAKASTHCFELTGQSPTEVFGSSETGGIAWRRRATMGEAWQVLPKVQWRIHDGLLEVRSPHLQDQTQWWTTADRVGADGAGANTDQFVFQGRVDRIVKIAEKRVSLTALENALLGCPEVEAARTLLIDQNLDTARIAAVVVLSHTGWKRLYSTGRHAMNEYLRSILRPQVEAVSLPRKWRYVEQLPVNTQGKTSQQSLLQLFRPVRPHCEWLQRDEHEALARLSIVPELLVFDGHFPQAPLVPGVAQLHWAHYFARQSFHLPGEALRLEALKFQQPIVPGQHAQLTLQWDQAKGTLRFSFESDVGRHSSGRMVFEVTA